MRITYATGAPVLVFNTDGKCGVLWLTTMMIFATVTRKLSRKMNRNYVVENTPHKENGKSVPIEKFEF